MGKSVIFASVSTLGRPAYLNERYFARDYFDYIVIDEFHHAVTDQYRRIIEYFQPEFLQGLTATPDRLDGRSLYELCDYNVPYEINLRDAINKGLLVPFHYYGIYDETVDYSQIRIVKGRYVEEELTGKLTAGTRYELIYRYYCKYRSRRALGFCCSRKHAEQMAKEFCRRNIPAAAVYSDSDGEYAADRGEAVRRLRDGELRVISPWTCSTRVWISASWTWSCFCGPRSRRWCFYSSWAEACERAGGRSFSMCWTLSATMRRPEPRPSS